MELENERAIADLLRNDTIYQKLLSDCLLAESAYANTLQRLSDGDRRILEHYITICEELDHRKLSLVLNHSPET